MENQTVNIKGFAVRIISTDEGIIVDIYDRAALEAGPVQPIASTWALDSETEAAE